MDNKLCTDCRSPSEHVIENPSLQALKESFSAYQQMQNSIVASACTLQSRMESMLQQRIQLVNPTVSQLTQLLNQLSQLTAQEIQCFQENFKPSDEFVESLNNTLQKATDVSDETTGIPRLSLSKSFIKDNLLGILTLIITIIFQFAPNAEYQEVIRQNEQLIKQNQKIIELDEKRSDLLQDIANTVHLLIDDSDMVRNALDALSDQEQPITIKLDKAVHSPTQNQNTDSEQENGD